MEMPMLTLAGAILGPIFTKLVGKAASYFGGDITDEEIGELTAVILPTIQMAIDAADSIGVDKLRSWLMRLIGAAFEAEDVLDEYDYKAKAVSIEIKVGSYGEGLHKARTKTKEFFSPVLFKTEMKKSLEKLQRLAEEAGQLISLLDSRISLETASRSTLAVQGHIGDKNNKAIATVSGLPYPVFGRREERDAIVHALLPPDGAVSKTDGDDRVLALCGTGGAGKTALAQYICEDERVLDPKSFDLTVWIHASQAFDEYRITKEIIEAIVDGESSPTGNLDVLQKNLVKLLEGQTFLLVLDDVWIKAEDRVRWDQMMHPLKLAGEAGSRILLTCRAGDVSSMLGVKSENIFSLKELKAADLWSIIKYYAFGDASRDIVDKDLLDVGDQIVSRLKNSPLAARCVGCSLANKTTYRTTVDRWKAALDNDLLKETMDVLNLSFQFLPPVLQRCFSYCSLYPKGFEYSDEDVVELVRMWVAQGFIDNVGKGRECFDRLVSYSFFELHQSGGTTRVHVVHDLYHYLAERVSKGLCFRIDDDCESTIPETTMHVSVATRKTAISVATRKTARPMPDISKLKNLRSFVILFCPKDQFDIVMKGMEQMFAKARRLRILHFGGKRVVEVKNSIGKLKHLRYLQVAWMDKFPNSMNKLYHLQFFLLPQECANQLTMKMNDVILKCICHTGEKYRERVRRLGGTRDGILTIDIPEKYDVRRSSQHGTELLGGQPMTRGLMIGGLENVIVDTPRWTAEPVLKHRVGLESLALNWRRCGQNAGTTDDMAADECRIEGFEPPPHGLQELRLDGYGGSRLPKWMVAATCSNLRLLELVRLPFLKSLTLGPILTALETVIIVDLENLTSMEVTESLPSFQNLAITGCDQLKSLPEMPVSLVKLGFQDCSSLASLPANLGMLYRLSNLEIYDCHQLKSLPGNLENLRLLERLEFKDCSKLELQTSLPWLLQKLLMLWTLQLSGCPSLKSLPDMPTSLMHLCIKDCENLTSLPANLKEFRHLCYLTVVNCPNVELLPDLPASLKYLGASGCNPRLVADYGVDRRLRHKISHIPGIRITY